MTGNTLLFYERRYAVMVKRNAVYRRTIFGYVVNIVDVIERQGRGGDHIHDVIERQGRGGDHIHALVFIEGLISLQRLTSQ
jgi:hypothetical protein